MIQRMEEARFGWQMHKYLLPISFIAIFSLSLAVNAQRPVRLAAEFDPCLGTLISWPLGIPQALVVDLAKDDTLYVVVGSTSDQTSAKSQFTSWDMNLNHVVFIQAKTDTHWSRDWGPDLTFDSLGAGGILDFTFNGYPHVPGCGSTGPGSTFGGFTNDDKVNSIVASALGWPLRSIPCYFTGGNNMVDGISTAISSHLMLDENSSHSFDSATFRNYTKKYCGITNYYFVDNPERNGIQHIDCFAKFLDEETILVKQVASSNPDYSCAEHLADQIKALKSCYGRPYKIIRIPAGEYSGSEVAAYTNSLIINKKVYVPLFGISTDQTALATFRNAMPGYTVTGYTHNGQWYYYDALHCRAMGIFDRYMLRITNSSLDSAISAPSDIAIRVAVDVRSGRGLIEDKCLLNWRVKGASSWQSAQLTKITGLDSMAASIPRQPSNTSIEYYLQAADSSGRTATLPRSAPSWVFSFKVLQGVSIADKGWIDQSKMTMQLHLGLAHYSRIAFVIPRNDRISLFITDLSGRTIISLVVDAIPEERITWDGNNGLMRSCPKGMYLAILKTNTSVQVKKILLTR
jgi:agmatine deiminase